MKQRLHDMCRWQQQYYSENKSHALFLYVNIWAVFCKSPHTVTWAWSSLNFDKEYLFGFETLVFETSGILSKL